MSRQLTSTVNTNLLFLERASNLVGEPIQPMRLISKFGGKKPMYNVRVHKTLKIHGILRQLLPYIIGKKDRAERFITMFEKRWPECVSW